MTVALSINGTTYNYPENQDENWGTVATQWATAVTNGMLQKAGGNFTLLADVNFGATYGLVSTYFKSRSSNISTTGVVRLANNEGVGFRNAANGADKIFKLDGSDKWSFGATALSEAELALLASVSGTLVTTAGTQTLTNKTLTTPVIASFISNGVTFTNPTADGSNGQVLKTNGSGALSFTTVVTNPMTTKGDLISTSTGSDVTRTAVGSNGALLFANSSATSGIDWTSTSGLAWDSSNSRLGIGTTAPTAKLVVNNNSSNTVPTLSSVGVGLFGADSSSSVFASTCFAAASAFVGYRSNGTMASPTTLVADDVITFFGARGYDGTSWSTSSNASISLAASQTWTSGAKGTYIQFNTTSNGSTTLSNRMRIDPDGNVGICTTIPTTRLGVNLNSSNTVITPSYAGTAVYGADSTNVSMNVYGFAAVPRVHGYRSAGTMASPTAVQTNQTAIRIAGGGHNGTSWVDDVAHINFVSEANWGVNDTALGIQFWTCPPSSSTAVARATVTSNGALSMLQTTGAAEAATIYLNEKDTTPNNPTSGSQVKIYMKTDAIVFQYNDGGTVRYKYLTLSGTGVTWTHSTTAP